MFNSILCRIIDSVMFGQHAAAIPIQCFVQKLIGGPKPALFSLDGHPFHCETSHKYYLERSNFEPHVWEWLRTVVTPEDVVYDVGAHFGFWAVRLSRFTKQVVCFEPSPCNFKMLTRNTGGLPNVTCYEVAIGATNGKVSISEAGSMTSIGEGIPVQMQRLDSFPSPTLLLVDVEGYAGHVLAGANLDGVRVVLCELHNPREEQSVSNALSDYEVTIKGNSYPTHLFAHRHQKWPQSSVPSPRFV